MDDNQYRTALNALENAEGFDKEIAFGKETVYNKGLAEIEREAYGLAPKWFKIIPGYKDADIKLKYAEAMAVCKKNIFDAEDMLKQLQKEEGEVSKVLDYINKYKDYAYGKKLKCTSYKTNTNDSSPLYSTIGYNLKYYDGKLKLVTERAFIKVDISADKSSYKQETYDGYETLTFTKNKIVYKTVDQSEADWLGELYKEYVYELE